MSHPELDMSPRNTSIEEVEARQQSELARNRELTNVAVVLNALVDKRETGPYSGKSLAWWKEALIDAQMSMLWFEPGDTDALISRLKELTGVELPDHDRIWAVLRLVEEIANYDDE